jgi:hypothetical protein
MSDTDTFLLRLVAARRAAWLVLGCGIALQLIVYGGYLGVQAGWIDGLIEHGVYGEITRARLSEVTFVFIAALKLLNTAILLGAMFLTLWVRGLRRPG